MSNQFRVISSTGLDLIEPFPLSEAHRVFGWMKCFKNLVETDDSPHTKEEYMVFLKHILPVVRSFGIIDRDSKLGLSHNAPIIGILMFEPIGNYNGYLHIASTRRAFGSKMMDEASLSVINLLFDEHEKLTRLSAWIHEKNRPAISLAKRVGFMKEGRMNDMILQNGEPRALVHLGLTRKEWEQIKCHSLQQQPHLLEDSQETSSEEIVADKSEVSPEAQLPVPQEEADNKEASPTEEQLVELQK